jgi:putative membrane protein
MTTYNEAHETGAQSTLGDRTDRAPDLVAWGLVGIYAFLTAGRSIAPDIFGAIWMIPTLLPVVFLVIHGARSYGVRTTLVFAAIVFVVSNVFENLSIATGFPFGHYHYSDFAGPKLFAVPLLIGPAYLGMGYLSWTLARLLLGRTKGALTGASLIAVPLVASFVMVAWDLTFDPVASTINGFWTWEQGGSYFGVPFGNFLGWFLTVFIFFVLFAVYLSRRAKAPATSDRLSGQYWLQAVALYVAATIPALLGPLTHSAIGAVIDQAGTVWQGNDVYLGVALVAIFTMVPFAVLGALRALDVSPAAASRAYDGLPQPSI